MTRIMPDCTSMPLEVRHGAKELLAVSFRAKFHDSFDASPVVPTAVKEHDFAGRGEVRYISLKVPLSTFTFARGREGNHLANARVEPLCDPLDHFALAGGVTAFE